MRINQLLLHGAVLGSTFAVVALAPAAAATLSDADKRALAVSGMHHSAAQGSTAGTATPKGVNFKLMHSFAGGANDGQDPTAEVTVGKAGALFGTTEAGGANNNGGTLFELVKGKVTLLHSFGATGDGATPDGAVYIDPKGNIFGTTQEGGAASNGTVWEYSAGGTYTLLHSFATNEGSFIRGHLVADGSGNLYGTALFGGANGDGSVFEYSTSAGTLTLLHSFDGTDGEFPEHGLAMDKSGNLYGATAFGGANGDGSVYEVSSSGTFSSLYSFTGGDDGSFLYGGVGADSQGNVYGAAASNGADGNGTAFEITSSGKFSTLYAFTGGTDGGAPEGDTFVVGKDIYGAATTGGANSEGGIYQVTTKGKETMVQPFSAADGDGYSAGVVGNKKILYGTTSGGGADGDGVVFSLKSKK